MPPGLKPDSSSVFYGTAEAAPSKRRLDQRFNGDLTRDSSALGRIPDSKKFRD
jgi:hypothetical protein